MGTHVRHCKTSACPSSLLKPRWGGGGEERGELPGCSRSSCLYRDTNTQDRGVPALKGPCTVFLIASHLQLSLIPLLQRNLVQPALWPFNLLSPEGTSGLGFLREKPQALLEQTGNSRSHCVWARVGDGGQGLQLLREMFPSRALVAPFGGGF